MGFWDWMQSSPAGMASSAAEGLASGVFNGIDKIIRDFKLPPETMVEYETKMAELQATLQPRLEEIAAADRNSARQREMAVKDKMPAVISLLFLSGFFAVLGAMMAYGAPAGAGSEAFLLILGTLTSGVGLVLGYYLGSSAGSSQKMAVIGSLTKQP